jgi:hypothetical protein
VRPKSLSRKNANHEWVFAVYWEFGGSDNGRRYRAFLFRNLERTIFGIKEWLGAPLPRVNAATLATKVVLDREFRESLISDYPDLPKMWKRH